MAVTNKNNVIELTLAKKSRPVTVNVVSLETAVPYIFKLIDYTPDSGMSARIYIEKEDGHLVYNACTISGNEVTFTPTTQCFNVGKMATAQLQIMSGSKVALSYLIAFVIEENIINSSAIESTDEFTALQQLINSAEAYNGIIGANNITGYNNRQGWTALTSGQNLNSITAPGVYYSNTTSITSTLLNCPTSTGSFKLIVEHTINAGATIRQTIIYAGVDPGFLDNAWTRKTTDGGVTWSDWIRQPMRAEVNAIANMGGKNLLPSTATTQTINGVTFTANADGSVTVNGTATANGSYMYKSGGSFPNGQFIFSAKATGTPPPGAQFSIGFAQTSSGSIVAALTQTNGFKVTANVTGGYMRCAFSFTTGASFDSTFYPMIRPASIQDDTYVPYGMSNAELTEKMASLGELSSFSEYKTEPSAGTYTYTLKSAHTYLVSVAKVNTPEQRSSLYLVSCFTNNSNITPIIDVPSNTEVSITGTTLTVTTKSNYNIIGITCIA